MKLIQADKLSKYIGSIIHQDTQQHSTHFDLTVSKIHRIVEAGSLDFGGGEFKPATKSAVEPQKNEGDDYGWWHLPMGTYQATMNEELREVADGIVLLAPHPHTQQAGIVANTSFISDNKGDHRPITVNFRVPEAGCNIKENARFAVLYLLAE